MTASPPAAPGMPGEEEIRRIVDDALNSAIPEPWEVSAHATQRILSLIRPAFEAKDAEIGQRAEEDLAAESSLDLWRQRALSAEAKLVQAVEAGKSLAEKLTKAEADVASAGGAKAVYFDGSLLICHPDMPPHIWDGKIMVKIEPTAIALAEGKEG